MSSAGLGLGALLSGWTLRRRWNLLWLLRMERPSSSVTTCVYVNNKASFLHKTKWWESRASFYLLSCLKRKQWPGTWELNKVLFQLGLDEGRKENVPFPSFHQGTVSPGAHKRIFPILPMPPSTFHTSSLSRLTIRNGPHFTYYTILTQGNLTNGDAWFVTCDMESEGCGGSQ